MEASSGGHNIPRIMTFRPTWDEFKDFNKFIEYVESQGAHKAGICKIIPPKEWVPREDGYDNLEVKIPAPIQQVVHGKQGLYTQYNVQKKPISVKDFQELANSEKFRPPRHTDYDDLERKYWKNITFINPIYGADVSGSLTDKTQKHWNIQKLGTILDCLGDDYGISIEGVNTAYLYFGMWKTTFAWHTEDMDLYSINYIHFGAAKRWYAIPPEHGRRLERLAAGFFPESNEQCAAFLRHKMTLISPMILKKYSIPYDTITQNEREIIVTFPYGYHAGFNQGFNCAESTNFASQRWIDYGKHCRQCHCRKDSVKIDMGAFVKRFQPKLYNLWVTGQDNAPHPEDDKKKLYQPQTASSNIKTLPTPLKRQAYPVKESTTFMDRVGRKRTADGQSIDNAQPKQQAETKSEPKASSSTSERSEFLSDATTDVTTDHNSDSNSKPTQPAVRECLLSEEIPDTTGTLEETKPTSNQSSPELNSLKKKKKKSKERKEIRKQDDSTADDTSVEDNLLRIDAPWAKSLTRLWKFNAHSMEQEIKYNKKQSRIYPHCAVCSVLNNEQCQTMIENQKSSKPKVPKMSQVLLPNSCYMSQDNEDFYTTKVSGKPRPLLICKQCKLAVHDTCYGVKMLPNGPENWICSRCTVITFNPAVETNNTSTGVPKTSTDGPSTSAGVPTSTGVPECCLCCMRGGALKPTDDGRWAHITCAVSNIEITFPSPNVKEPISLKLLDKQRITLKCSYCGIHSFKNGKDRYGFCVQCSVGSCNKSFHLTCARMAGLHIDIGTLPFKLCLSCNKHQPNKVEQSGHAGKHLATNTLMSQMTRGRCAGFKSTFKKEEDIERPALKLTDPVYARYRNGRFYRAKLLSAQKIIYYMVIFDDNSISKDLYPHDIINFEVRDGKPPLGSFVKVKWTDGVIYNGHFQGSREVELFTVEFEDMTKLQLEREHVWSINEKVPSFVQKRLSSATDMKDDVFYKTDKELMTDKRTRGVQANYMYRFL